MRLRLAWTCNALAGLVSLDAAWPPYRGSWSAVYGGSRRALAMHGSSSDVWRLSNGIAVGARVGHVLASANDRFEATYADFEQAVKAVGRE